MLLNELNKSKLLKAGETIPRGGIGTKVLMYVSEFSRQLYSLDIYHI